MAISAGTQDRSANISHRSAKTWQTWLTQRRIVISLILFTALVLADMFLLGVRPRNVFNWSDAGTLAGELLVLSGLAIRSWAAGTLAKGKSLIHVGPYALVRNPLYVGSFLMMFGFCALVHDWQSIWFIVGPVAAIYWLQVGQEEEKLAQCFAAQWPAYAASTPRFLPRRFSSAALQGWSLRLWLHNREYQALLASAAGMAGLVWWHSLSG